MLWRADGGGLLAWSWSDAESLAVSAGSRLGEAEAGRRKPGRQWRRYEEMSGVEME